MTTSRVSAEEQLAARVRQKDLGALAEFITLRQPQLLAYIQRQLGTGLKRKLEPEDVLQDTSAEAVRALPSMDLAERDVFQWLCQVAQRRIIDAHRRLFGAQKRDASREVSLDAPAGTPTNTRRAFVDLLVVSMTTPSQAFSRNQREARLQQALAKLPAEQQEALRLRYVEDLPSKDIAQRLGKTDGAVRVMLTRAIQKLQDILEEST
ncbi:MAG: sigma-70 family RNA polymerase sigma factor [Planctomycetia bacterium]|nr:sigma-70 family RNA polymerase sigma factor [Planctomycetia bacterium]